jgi:hypothetical protein
MSQCPQAAQVRLVLAGLTTQVLRPASSPGFVTGTGETVNVGRGRPVELFVAGDAAVLAVPILRPAPGADR